MRRPLLVGSVLASCLALLGAGVVQAAGVQAGAARGPAAPVQAPQLLTEHLDQSAPGAKLLSGTELVAGSGVRKRPARFTPRLRRTLSTNVTSSTAADVLTPVALLSVPGGTAVLGGLATHVSPSCSTTDADRVQVVYAHEQSTPSRYSQLLGTLRSYVADVDDTFALSSPQSGRRVRWVIDANCQPVIADVTVPNGTFTANTGASALRPMMTALAARGMDRPDRKYLVFADAPTNLCGIGQSYRDTTPGSTNANDGGYPMYARVDPLCWPTRADYHSTPAHELMHMLGAVQPNAPHATAYGHCTDEHDAMCYADSAGVTVTNTCTQPGAEALFDCNHNDYFNAGPTVTGYLATSWNTANSSFLDVVAPLSGAAVSRQPVTVAVAAPARLYVAATGRVTVTVASPTGRVATGVTLQVYVPKVGWRSVASASSSTTGVASFAVRSASVARLPLRVLVPATSRTDAASSAVRTVLVVRRPTSTRIAVRAGRPDHLFVTVRTGAAVSGQYVLLQSRYVGTTAWRTVARRVTNRSGQVVIAVQPRRRTDYRWVYTGSPALAPSVSPAALVIW